MEQVETTTEQQIPENIVFCEFYNNCNHAEPNMVCLSGGGKYCGTHRTKSIEKGKQRKLLFF